jgi:hypothetical protein
MCAYVYVCVRLRAAIIPYLDISFFFLAYSERRFVLK